MGELTQTVLMFSIGTGSTSKFIWNTSLTTNCIATEKWMEINGENGHVPSNMGQNLLEKEKLSPALSLSLFPFLSLSPLFWGDGGGEICLDEKD